jgi:glycine oxidase
MKHTVIVGGGIVGCHAAFFLTSMGRKVTLLDRFPVASKASGCNPGGLNPLHGPGLPGIMSPLAERSFQLNFENWEKIRELSGMDFPPHRVSRVELAFDEAEKASLVASIPHYGTIDGFSARWMERGELLEINPGVNPSILGGLWTEGNGMVDSRNHTRAVAAAARELGADFRMAGVIGLETRGSRVTGVETDDVTLPCDDLVIATGSWAAEAGQWLGVSIPVRPVKGQLLMAELKDAPARHHHVTWKMIGIYRTPEGNFWFGGTQEEAGFDESPTEQGHRSILDSVSRLIPEARHAKITDHMAALRPATSDGLPIIDRVPGWENACVTTGAGPKGMLIGAGMAEAVSLIMSGMEPRFDIAPYRLDRFHHLAPDSGDS